MFCNIMDKENNKTNPATSMRLDKWLKIARLIKTRSKAEDACENGRVKVNDAIAKPSKLIKVGDKILLRWYSGQYRKFDVLGLSQKCLAAAEAQKLYREYKQELSPEQEEMMKLYKESVVQIRLPKVKGRPTKKLRREMDKIKRR